MTNEELDEITNIMFNLPLDEIRGEIANLSPEAREILGQECLVMAARLKCIAELT